MSRTVRRLLHSVVQGSAVDANAFIRALGEGGHKATVLITDPPYLRLVRRRKLGDEREPPLHARVRKLASDVSTLRFENVAAYARFTEDWLHTALTHGLEPHADLIIWTNPLGRSSIIEATSKHSYSLSSEFMWAKNTKDQKKSAGATNEILLRMHESALVFRHESNNIKSIKGRDWSSPTAVITPHCEHDHPCHKPLDVMLPLLHAYTRSDDVILDCFAGSGGTLLAAAACGRKATGIEILPYWVERANEGLLKIQTG